MAEVASPTGEDRPEPVEGDEPLTLFAEWLKAAEASESGDANALALATVDESGLPNVRMVLLKGADERGFVFYTNVESAKGHEILANPQAAMCFHWKSLGRQVRVRGAVVPVSSEEADAYFATRARTSRIGAWASRQSQPLESRFALEKSVAVFAAKHLTGAIPRPPNWSGLRLIPTEIEFWRHGSFRLHERVQFRRHEPSATWSRQRLYP